MEVAAASVTASRTGQCHRIKEVRVAEMDDYNAKVIEEFRGNGGVVGGQRMYLLLTTAGAKTGLRRTTPLVCQVGGDGVLYIFASKAGAPRHPDWYYNLAANPRVGVEYGTDKFDAIATTITGTERDDIFDRQVEALPVFGEYRSKADRVIPVVELRRA